MNRNVLFQSTLSFISLLIFTSAFAQDRVEGDLLTLYNFSEGQGSYVNDISGFDTPLLLHIEDVDAVEWIAGGGISIQSPTLIHSFASAAKISDNVKLSNEISLEVWMNSASIYQNDYKRIMSISHGANNRNATIGQDGDDFFCRLRTTNTTDNGTPNFNTTGGQINAELQHVVYTRNSDGLERIYIDGNLVDENTREGVLSNWDSDYKLVLANEINANRPWTGEIYLAATYSRALSEDEVLTNYNAGHIIDGPSTSETFCSEEDCFIDGFGTESRVLWLPILPDGVDANFAFDEEGGHFDLFEDGTAHLYGQCINMEDPDYGWFMDIWLTDKMQWTEWSSLDRWWKGDPAIVGDHYLDWDYYIIDPEQTNLLIGTGNFDGSELSISHKPSDYYYGFQKGIAANDKNDLPGMSCWFFCTGEVNGMWIDSYGDMNMEGECTNLPVIQCATDLSLDCQDGYDPSVTGEPIVFCPEEYTLSYYDIVNSEGCETHIERHWIATSINGDEVECIQNIYLSDTTSPIITVNSGTFDNCDFNETSLFTVSDDCDSSPDYTVTVLDSTWNTNSECESGQLRTQTMGGWGTEPSGNNPGVYLTENFASAFPDGLTIGCDNTLTLTSAQAVIDFLPSGSTPSALPDGNITDPGIDYENVLAGQLVAATLSTTFDNYDPDFGDSDFALEQLFIQSGEYSGFPVSEILSMANELIGGCGSENYSSINAALSSINENYVDGTTNNGFLGCDLPYDCYLTYEIEVTATDDCGNNSTEIISAIILDTQDPIIPNFEEFITVECDQIPDPQLEIPEGCFGETLETSVVDVEFSGSCYPTIHRTYTLIDQCGNTVTFTQYITVIDTQAPTFINPPANLVLDCNDDVPTSDVEAIDNCGDPLVTFTESIDVDGCDQLITRTWTAEDQCGNISEISQEILITDNTAPSFNLTVSSIEVECGNFPEPPTITAFDECSGNVGVFYQENTSGGPCSDITRIWTAVDACGNTAIMTQNLTVIDNEAPVFVDPPENMVTDCNNIPEIPEVSVTDNCDPSVDITFTENMTGAGCVYTLNRTWIAQDDCGNTSIVLQSIQISDTSPPVFDTAENEISLDCSAVDGLSNPVITDDCSGNIILEYSDELIGSGCSYDILRTYTATDLCGNQSNFELTIHVTDTTPPEIIGADPVINSECSVIPDPQDVEAFDNCGEVVELVMTEEIFGEGCSFTINRVWTATDECGNTGTFSQLIIVSDIEAPVFESAPEDIILDCNEEIPLFDEPVVSDNCTLVPEITLVTFSQNNDCDFIITNIWTVSDACGNSNSFTQHITVTDNTAPVFEEIPEDIEINCGEIEEVPIVYATDNCDAIVTISFNQQTVSGNCPYSILRTWTATDDCGNSTSATQTILVNDDEAPVLSSLPEDIVVNCGEIPDPEPVFATDNCSDFVPVSVMDIWDVEDCAGQISRIWTAIDLCGNEAQHTQIITLIDNEPPLFVDIPQDMVVECSDVNEMMVLEATDNCSTVEILLDEEYVPGECPNEFTLVRSWTAVDQCGNFNSVEQHISVVDNSAPNLSEMPEDLEVTCENIPEYPIITATDDCQGIVEVDFTEEINFLDSEQDVCDLGNTQTLNGEVAILLPNLGGFGSYYVFGEEGATFIENELDGTATVTGQVYNVDDANQSFIIDILLYDKMNWDEWSATGGSYKDDFGYAGDNYLDWTYYKLDNTSQLIGSGIFDGSILNLTHAPEDFTFGFQIGLAANNSNDAYGMSGWFAYSGNLFGQDIEGVGDLITENNCCPDQEIIRTWTATDCAGNTTSWSQTIQVSDQFEFAPLFFAFEPSDFDVFGSEGDQFIISFTPRETSRIVIDILSIDGSTIDHIYDGAVDVGRTTTLFYPKDNLPVGTYLFRLSTGKRIYTDLDVVANKQ